jgi:HD-GYP domain-containing protein (c-di-GMP phosphodiesterase class II)
MNMQHELTPLVYLSEKKDPTIKKAVEQSGSKFKLFSLTEFNSLQQHSQDYSHFIFLADENNLKRLNHILKNNFNNNNLDRFYIIGLGENAFNILDSENSDSSYPQWNVIISPFQLNQVKLALKNARQHLLNKLEVDRLKQRLHLQNLELRELYDIGIALSAERNPDALLEMILKKSREITHADAGSLYLVETVDSIPEDEKNYFANKQLRFKLAHNDSVKISFKESVMPIQKQSIAGYVALENQFLNIPDVYDLPANCKYGHNRSFDESIRYRTKSMLVIPMKTHKDEIIAVLQLINRKKEWDTRLTSPEIIEQEVVPFDDKCVDLACSLASQAAISIENNRLYEEIKNLFEGFIRASVLAIEQRDPTTFGHSERVATLTVALAKKVDRIDTGKFKQIKFTREEVQQINYAALLHDFGKIGVREDVLIKAKKLFPHELDAVKNRFKIFKQATELRFSNEKITCLLREEKEKALSLISRWDQEARNRVLELDRYFHIILELNEPTVLKQTGFEMLRQISSIKYNENGSSQRLLTTREFEVLSIPKGSLSKEERKEIESHVTHTFNFLSKIPWTSELKRVPQIASTHHEKLDGSGYPHGLNSGQIPIEAKMMTIADIYDALTAWDRPYKRAVPLDKALEIIQWEVKDGKVDPDLFQIFLDARLFELVKKPDRV